MSDLIIKICGVRDPVIAEQAVKAGANLIGIIFHPGSPRYVDVDHAIAISDTIIKAGAKPVAVFVNQSFAEMHEICELTNIKTIQLHGTFSRSQHYLFSNDYQRIYVKAAGENQDDKGMKFLDCDRDMILIDHPDSGCGKSFDWKTFKYNLPFRWLLAGGLTPSTVASAIHELLPDGVDVSSGVEVSRGQKDIALIKQFILSVREYENENTKNSG